MELTTRISSTESIYVKNILDRFEIDIVWLRVNVFTPADLWPWTEKLHLYVFFFFFLRLKLQKIFSRLFRMSSLYFHDIIYYQIIIAGSLVVTETLQFFKIVCGWTNYEITANTTCQKFLWVKVQDSQWHWQIRQRIHVSNRRKRR